MKEYYLSGWLLKCSSQLLSHDRKQEKIIATVISSLIYEPLDNLTLQDNPTDINTQAKIAQRNMIERFNPLINSFYGEVWKKILIFTLVLNVN